MSGTDGETTDHGRPGAGSPRRLALLCAALFLLAAAGRVAYIVHYETYREIGGAEMERAGAAIVAVHWEQDGVWSLTSRSGRAMHATLLPSTLVTPYLVVLNFRLAHFWQRRSVVLLSDNCDAVSLRRLRVRLRAEGISRERDVPGLRGPHPDS